LLGSTIGGCQSLVVKDVVGVYGCPASCTGDVGCTGTAPVVGKPPVPNGG
jgi:hypothetical protein